MSISFNDFLQLVPRGLQSFVINLNEYLIDKGCKVSIAVAKNGYVTSYTSPATKKTLLNYVFRKTGMKMRIYAANVAKYQDFLNDLPTDVKENIAKALDCKKLNGGTCSPTCPAGYAFFMDGAEYRKCRSMAFMPTLNEKNCPFISRFIELELENS